jgi:hypothetical protein
MPSLNRFRALLSGLVLLLYIGGRLGSSPSVLQKPRILADTAAYVRISLEPIGQIGFWIASRPPAFPLLLKLAAQNFNLAAAFQLCLSVVAWSLLALLVSRFLKPSWVGLVGLALILVFSLDRHVAGWDFVMMTESLSISSLVLFIACGLLLLKGWQWIKVAALFAAAFLLAFTRDTNAWMLLAVAACVTAAVILHWMERRALLLGAGLALIFLLGNASATLGERWVFPLGNLITQRILTDPSALKYFQSCGMPTPPALLQLAGKYANSDDQAMFAGAALQGFRYWLVEQGKACYVGWLIANPIASLEATLHETGVLVAFSTVDRFFSNRYMPLLPDWLAGILYPEQFTLWIWGVSTLAIVIAIARRLWRTNALWAAVILMNLLILPHLFLTWHGDAMAPERHALSVGVQLYLGFWLLGLLLIRQFLPKSQTAP